MPRAFFHALRRNFVQQKNHLDVRKLIQSLSGSAPKSCESSAFVAATPPQQSSVTSLIGAGTTPIGFNTRSGD
jgi:hypothetical protein